MSSIETMHHVSQTQRFKWIGYSNDAPRGAANAVLVETMDFYVYAANAWNAHIVKDNFASIGSNPIAEKCAPLRESVAQTIETMNGLDPNRNKLIVSDSALRRMTISASAVTIFTCASEDIAKAERLIGASTGGGASRIK